MHLPPDRVIGNAGAEPDLRLAIDPPVIHYQVFDEGPAPFVAAILMTDKFCYQSLLL
jgi:hypothetical protein